MILPKYAVVDLADGQVSDYPISQDMFEKYIGGKTLAARILYDVTAPGIDPLSPEAVLIVNTSPMNGTGAPSSSRFNCTFKNVLTGGIASSNCGGMFGVMMKRAGLDGLILKGSAPELSVLEVIDGKITLRAAPELAGQDTEEVQKNLPKAYGKLVIGPAGENLVKYACAASGERVAGRCGIGAVMGSKNLKAIVAYGTKRAHVEKPEEFTRYLRKWVKFIKSHPMTGQSLPLYGSAGILSKANASHALPTKNFSSGRYDKADDISGETLAEKHLTKNSSCISCPIRCERRVMVGGKDVKGPEYETLGLFGANIENSDLQLINDINYKADLLGLDTISLGGTIAFAMELKEKGMADFDLEFGRTDNLLEIIEKIARREGKYSDLAEGSKILSEKYGGEEFAIHAKGLELAAYEPRRSVGMGLGFATANRGGCHLNGGYLALMESVGVIGMDAQQTKGKAELTVFMQNGLEACSAAGFCLFSMQSIVPAFLFKSGPSSRMNRIAGSAMLAARGALGAMWKIVPWGIPINTLYLMPQSKAIALATGLPMTTGRFLELGDRGYNLERMYNIREGLTAEEDSLPAKLTKTPQEESRSDTVVNLDAMLPRYYQVRGWDEKGMPTEAKLKKLGLV